MKNKIFNAKIFLDTIKRLKLVAIIMAIISVIPSLLMAFSEYMTMLSSRKELLVSPDVHNGYAASSYIPVSPALENAVPGLYIFMFLGALLLVYTAFSFLNKRSGSDFFHSLPCTRNCAYLSMGAAVISVIFATVVISVLATWFAYAVFGLVFIAGYVPILIASFFAGSALVASAAAVAVCLTGTRLTNVTLTGLIIFLPRMILYIFVSLITMNHPVLSATSFGWFMSHTINIPVSSIITGFGSVLFGQGSFLNYGPALYTMVLAIIYIVLGCIAFNRRKSESAAKSAPSKLLQHVYRCLITMPVMLIFLFSRGYRQGLAIIVIFVVLSLVVYFLYEIITTKTARRLLRTLPSYLILVAFTALFGISANMSGNAMSSYVPYINDVDSISLAGGSMQYYSHYGAVPSYNSNALRNVKLTNDRANEIAINSLKYESSLKNNDDYDYFMERKPITFNLKRQRMPQQMRDLRRDGRLYHAAGRDIRESVERR